MRHNVRFKVSLSTGDTIFEGKGDYQDIDGQPSPWQRLLYHLEKTGATITSLSLYTDQGQTWNLPSAGKRPKFRAFDAAEKPVGYECFRCVGRGYHQDGTTTKSDLFTVARAEYPDGTMEIWVDEADTRNCWTLFLKK